MQWLGHRTGNHTHTYKISWHERSPSLHPTPWAALSRASVLESCRVGSFPHLITILIEPVQPSLRSPDDRYRKWVALKKSFPRSPSPPAPKRQRTPSIRWGKCWLAPRPPVGPGAPSLLQVHYRQRRSHNLFCPVAVDASLLHTSEQGSGATTLDAFLSIPPLSLSLSLSSSITSFNLIKVMNKQMPL